MSNSWMDHVKRFRQKHPKMPYKDVLKNARASYKPKSATAGGTKKPVKASPARKTKKEEMPAKE